MISDPDVVVIEIGGNGHLTDTTVYEMATAPAMVHVRHPKASITLTLGNFDADPRELWDIPEAADYVRRYAAASGLRDWRSKQFGALDEPSKALLVLCKALIEPHPYRAMYNGEIRTP